MLRRAAAIALLSAGACIERAPNAGAPRERVDPSVVARWTVADARPRLAGGALFGGAIELVGADLDPPELAPGGAATLTLYWRALEEVEQRWAVFVHVDAAGAERLHGDHEPAGGAYPTSAWRRGDVVRDPMVLRVPPAYAASTADVWVGLYSGSERLALTRPGALGGDGENRALVAHVAVRQR